MNTLLKPLGLIAAVTFLVAGCGGNDATDRFDTLTPLVDWVEKGVAPGSIVATASPGYLRKSSTITS